jgi:glutamate N-acetyltransferase/amino-acid N-acetyltransferase
VAGVRLGAAAAGIKHAGRPDLLVIELAEGGDCVAVFTRNAFCAAPVLVARQHLRQGPPRYLLVNSGNANAGTGETGLAAARACCDGLAERGGCRPEQVLPFSTGVIGENLPVERLLAGLQPALDGLSEDGWPQAAEAIMTTDTRPKLVSRRIQVAGRPVTVTGIAKGAGMIRPDMATMLAYLATDAGLEPALLQACLERAVAPSFNSISVDGDTSTNDACVLLASGRGARIDDPEGADYLGFCNAVEAVCMELARAIVADGEGATKLVEIAVEGAVNEDEARQVAYTIAHSPLVKTALFASDPNWGRILAAVGRAGVVGLDIARVEIWLGEVCIVRNGGRDPGYTEAAGQAVMAHPELRIGVRLGRGEAGARVLTCDLSYDYVRINAEYRT